MKFNLVPLVFAAIRASDDSPADFAALKAETETMKTQFLHDSESIDAKLRSIVEHKPKESFVQLESMEEMKRHRHQFEQESATLLEANKARVEKYRERFDQLLSKLREDVSDKNYGSSFLELSQEAPLDIDKLFAETKAKVDKLHFISRDIRQVVNHWKTGAAVPPPPIGKDSFDNIEV